MWRVILSSNYLIQTVSGFFSLRHNQNMLILITFGMFFRSVFWFFLPLMACQKTGASPQVSFHSILTICYLSRQYNSPLYPCPRSPGNCWVDQATCEISDWTWTPSHYLNESSHCKSKLCSASGLSTFNTFWFKGLWSVIISYFMRWYPVCTGKEWNKTTRGESYEEQKHGG